jgi:hypothetical protein
MNLWRKSEKHKKDELLRVAGEADDPMFITKEASLQLKRWGRDCKSYVL